MPNDYDTCTSNKIVNREQLTILFRIDNLKSSYVEQLIIDKLIDNLNNKFKSKKKMLSETNDLIHKYLGITIS